MQTWGIKKMENIQTKYAELFKHSCYCFCLCYKYADSKNEWKWLQYISEAVQLEFIDTDCYVSKPLKFIELIGDKSFRDIEKVAIHSIKDIPTEPTIVEMACPSGGSHFVVCHRNGNTAVLDFDPSIPSKSWENKKFISYRRFI